MPASADSTGLSDFADQFDDRPVLFTADMAQRLEVMAPVIGVAIDQLADVVLDGVRMANDGQFTDEQTEAFAWLEAEKLVLSFAASDQHLAANEYWIVALAFPELVDEAGEGSGFRRLQPLVEEHDAWKYSASTALRLLSRIDRLEHTSLVARYASAAIPLAKLVCAVDDEMAEFELDDLRRFQAVVWCAQAAADGRFTEDDLETIYVTSEMADQIDVDFNDQALLDLVASVPDVHVLADLAEVVDDVE
jgi:hypothetical protein